MTKKDLYCEEAERLYVCENFKLYAIAKKLHLGEKTIRLWRKENDWDTKKQEFLKSKQAFHEELYELSRKIMRSIGEDIDRGEKVEAGRMFAFSKMLPLFKKVKEYEDLISKNQGQPENKSLSEDVINHIQEEILGMKPKNKRGIKENGLG